MEPFVTYIACRTKIEGNMILKPCDFPKKSKEKTHGSPRPIASENLRWRNV